MQPRVPSAGRLCLSYLLDWEENFDVCFSPPPHAFLLISKILLLQFDNCFEQGEGSCGTSQIFSSVYL